MVAIFFLIFSFSNALRRWGLERVTGEEPLLYICEAPLANVHNMATEDRTYDYGLDIEDPEKVPCGPYFINQPVNVVFDLSKKSLNNDVSLRYYLWFMHVMKFTIYIPYLLKQWFSNFVIHTTLILLF